MKFKSLLFAAFAAVFSFAACEENQDLGQAAITISEESMTFATAGETKTLVLSATRDWRADNIPEWLTVTPSSGEGSLKEQTITLTAANNSGYTLEGKITFTIGMLSKDLIVSQEGPKGILEKGTAENPYTASEALAIAQSLTAEGEMADVHVKGVVTEVSMNFSYGSATYDIADKAGDSNTFLIYGGRYFGGEKFVSTDQLVVGDEVVVKGTIINYNGNTPEITTGSEIISINGKTEPDGDVVGPGEPKTVTIAEFLAAAETAQEYIVTGTIISISASEQHNNADLTITDGKDELYIYRMKPAGDVNIVKLGLNVNDIITVKGVRSSYQDAPQMGGGVYVSHEDKDAPVAAEGSLELSFTDVANRTNFTAEQQVWSQNGITLTNDKGSSTTSVADYSNPARFYKSSKLTVALADGKTMVKVDFVCNSTSYATALKSSIPDSTSVTVSGAVVTVTFATPVASYVVESLSGGQVRMNSITVYTK